ncbi:Ppx/GppA phosphatase family protein [Piscinibacter sp.]|uniref:Ppx/GppA phosphatase family protein n=1 Tax=Piscinibacter sp. TaxID=1903157 RepID=UPI002C5E9DD3|nr:Ppx/GppA phosphatase family protein [Albitalea sp.]HUG24254.1 Ppx/GppA phosphatase family protein [Albitalea sp.]
MISAAIVPSTAAEQILSTRWPGQLAAVDIGSNSFRLEIAQLHQGRYRRLDYLKETVRLGGGLDGNGRLTEEAAARGLACLARFAQRLTGFEPWQVRAVATQTLREARNRDAFLARARTVLGQPIEVISGREEARLIYAGVARLQPSPLPRLVVDIGGRSTELILGRGRKPLRAESFQVGSVSLSMKYFEGGRFTEAAFRAAQIAAGAELEEALEPFAPSHWAEALGSSGTVGAVSQLLAASRVTDGRITPPGLRWLMEQCLRAGHVDRLALPGLKEERRAVIAGGLSILYTLAVHFGIEVLQPARGALRQGVIFDLEERLQAAAHEADGHDIRDASVRELQRRFIVDTGQAERVRSIAECFHDSVQPRASHDARRELQWACALHEVGMMVSHHDHHRHSAYVLAHVDAAGFSQSQQRRLAELVLAQRGGLRKVEAALSQADFAWQVMCLRLATIKCHARGGVDAGALKLRQSGGVATLSLPAGWADANPRTLHLLNEEVAAWERGGPLSLELKR